MITTPVLIVGGGITGLSCAHALRRERIDFLLVEKSDRLGGTIRTERCDGFLLDSGPDAFLAQKPDAVALCRELDLDARLVSTNPADRTVYVLFRGRLHPLPEGMVLTVPTRVLPLALSGLFSPGGKLRMALELFVPPRRESGDESIASFVRRRLGRQALERLAEPLLAGIHSGDPERLSMHALFPRFVALERKHGSLIRGMRRGAASALSAGGGSTFLSLAGGLAELVERLAERLPPGSLRAGVGAGRVRREADRYVTELDSGQEISSRALVLALPVREMEVLARGLSPELASALAGVRTVSAAVVFLAFRREDVRHPLSGYGFVVPRVEKRRILAATFVSSKFPGRAPRDQVLLRAFFGGARDPEALALDDGELVALARRELEDILGPLGIPRLERVYRWRDRTPQIEVGHADRLRVIESSLAALPGLQVAGSGIRGVGIPDCIADGRRAAEAVVHCLREARQAGSARG